MKRPLLLLFLILMGSAAGLMAQEPGLPTKGQLSTELLSAKTYSNPAETDTSTIFYTPAGDYTL